MRNQQILLGEVPKSKLGAEHFKLAESEVPKPAEGEVLVRVRLISLDAANRAWMQGATYRSAVTAGNVMAGGAVAEVVNRARRTLRLAISSLAILVGRNMPRFRRKRLRSCRRSSR